MEKTWTNKYKNILIFILALSFLLQIPLYFVSANSVKTEKKVIVMIMDETSLEDILNSKNANIKFLLDNGGLGLMNTRAKSAVANRGSTYLSLGMGIRTLASTQGGLAFDSNSNFNSKDYYISNNNFKSKDAYKLYTGKDAPDGEILNISISDITKTALDITPNNKVGAFGDFAKENNLSIGFIGNADLDKPSREATMLAMDSDGVIPFGNISDELLINDNNILGGVRLDENKVLDEVNRILPKIDILFIDYGDSSRITKMDRLATDDVRRKQKQYTISKLDFILGEIMNKVNMENTMFMILSPNPSKEMISMGNFGLTPFIMYTNNMEKSILYSKLTKRNGLVTNFDLAPTIFNYFDINTGSTFSGESIDSIKHSNPENTLLKNQQQFLYLRKYRKVFHWSYIILAGICLFSFYLPKFLKTKSLPLPIINYLTSTLLFIPIIMLSISILGYKYIFVDIIYLFIASFLLGFILNKLFNNNIILSIGIIGLLTSILILLDTYIFQYFMIISPLGSDAIAGGRFYGLGNDYMGILLGSTILGLFCIFEVLNTKKNTIAIVTSIFLIFCIIGLSPVLGANMGGTISALGVLLFSLFIIFEKNLSFRKLILIGFSIIIFILVVASIDAIFNPSPTHAGKAMIALTNGGSNKLIEIIRIKLSQVFWNLFHASWNIILFGEIILLILLYKFKKTDILKIKEDYSILYKAFKIIIIASAIIFMFNDTGTIAAAMIILYALVPFGMLLNKNQ